MSYRQGCINTPDGNININSLVSYYESEDQASAILSVCNSHETLLQLMDKLKRESEFMISPIGDYDVLSSICQGLLFENDTNSKRVMAVAPLPADADADASYVEAATDSLQGFIRELLRAVLSNVILDKMPVVELVDKERALFYLELPTWYNGNSERVIKPIDWFDIRKVWEKSRSFRFSPALSSESLNGLVERLTINAEEYISRPARRGVLWIDVPEECDDNMSDIHEIIWRFRERGYMILLGVRSITGQRDFKAILCLMEGEIWK